MSRAFGTRPPGGSASGLAPNERRRHTRRRAGAGSAIILPTGQALKCSILDISKSGAQLSVASVLGIPATFVLQLPDGQTCQVQVVRRGVARLGVKFL